jgi:hypothetical protein
VPDVANARGCCQRDNFLINLKHDVLAKHEKSRMHQSMAPAGRELDNLGMLEGSKSKQVVQLDADRESGTWKRKQMNLFGWVKRHETAGSRMLSVVAKERRALVVGHFVSKGVSPYMISRLLTKDVHAALCAMPPPESVPTLCNRTLECTAMIRERLKGILKGRSVCIIVDEATKRFGLSCQAAAILASCADVNSGDPMLLKLCCLGQHATAKTLKCLIEKSVQQYEIGEVIGIAGDNATVNAALAKSMNVPHYPCVCHSLNLVLKRIFGIVHCASKFFSRLKMFLNVGGSSRARELKKQGIHPTRLQAIPTRWTSYKDAVEELLTCWSKLQEFVGGVKRDSKVKRFVQEWLGHENNKVRCGLYLFLAQEVTKCIEMAEKEHATPKLWFALTCTKGFLERYKESPGQAIGDALAVAESVRPKSTPTSYMDSRCAKRVSEELGQCLRKAMSTWNDRVEPALPVMKTRFLLSAKHNNGDHLPTGLRCLPLHAAALAQYEGFKALVARTRTELQHHPPDTGTELQLGLTEYWMSQDEETMGAIKAYALRILSIPTSSAAAERVFALMRGREDPDRSQIGDKMLSREIFLAYNSSLMEEKLKENLAKEA